jgi:hypothetical protein
MQMQKSILPHAASRLKAQRAPSAQAKPEAVGAIPAVRVRLAAA